MNRKVFVALMMVAMLLATLMLPAAAAVPMADVTVVVEDSNLFVTVASGGMVKTFYHKASGAVTYSMPVSDRYVFSAMDKYRKTYDIYVLEGDQAVAMSYKPGETYTPGGCVVDHPGAFTVLRQIKPKTGYSVGPAPAPVGNELQLRVVDPQMIIVVRDGDDRVTFISQPEASTHEMASAGPYIAGATNSKPYDILIFDATWKLVGRSFEYGEPYTRWEAPIPGPGLYWIFPQAVPWQYLGKQKIANLTELED